MENEELRLSSISVRRDTKYENLVDKFCSEESTSGKRIFHYKKDLMVFAALVGYANQEMVPIYQGANTISINLETYSSDQKDAFIYLLALMERKDAKCLKNKNINEAIKIFEGYCNGGLGIIQRWIVENSSEPDVINILLDKIYVQIQKNNSNVSFISNDDIEVEF